MQITINLYCPRCSNENLKKNGKKPNGKQNYRCKACSRQLVGDHALSYNGCHSGITKKVELMLVRGVGIRDIATIERISVKKVLAVLALSNPTTTPKHRYYERLEVDELWTYVGCKQNRLWLMYAYSHASSEVVAHVWGSRSTATAKALREQLAAKGVSFGKVCTDRWSGFTSVFRADNHAVGKANTTGIEGNNCRLRHRIRRAFRKTCCFSKTLRNHLKTFNLAFSYINHSRC